MIPTGYHHHIKINMFKKMESAYADPDERRGSNASNAKSPNCQKTAKNQIPRSPTGRVHPLELADSFESLNDPDQLFLLPDSVLTMDSITFREDVASVAPCFLTPRFSNHSLLLPYQSDNSYKKPLQLQDDTEGLILTKASNGCLWLCDTTIIDIQINNSDVSNSASKHSVSSMFENDQPARTSRRQSSNRSPSERYDSTSIQKEREERVRRLREQQEDERRKKLDELRQHALAAQKFREQQEHDRRRHLEELRFRDEDKRSQVEERRKAIEAVERERREALLKKNQEREERLEIKRRQQSSQQNFAFGSSTPRILGSTNEVWKGSSRSTSSSNVTNQLMTQSLYSRRSSERESVDYTKQNPKKTQRAISTHGLNLSGKGLSIPNQRSPSAASNGHGSGLGSGAKLRESSHPRKPRPLSIATTGIMSSSFHEKGSKFGAMNSIKFGSNSQKLSGQEIGRNRNVDDDDSVSNSSTTSSTHHKPRRTPAQVKAESAIKKSKKSTLTPSTSVKSLKVEAEVSLEPDFKHEMLSNTTEVKDKVNKKQEKLNEGTTDDVSNSNNNTENDPELVCSVVKKNLISTEDLAKARLAEKRREVKERLEREAELEGQKLLAIQRQEEEQRQLEEEQARLQQEEADRLAEEARRLEDERLRRAIEENERREREQREREERLQREKEEAARRAKEEEEKKRIEREEKLRKEEDERNERKLRIAKIMERTRMGKTSTVTPPPQVTENINADSKESNIVVLFPNSAQSNEQMMDKINSENFGNISDKTIEMETTDIERGQISTNNEIKQINSAKFDTVKFKHQNEKSMLVDNGHNNPEQIIEFFVNSSTNGHNVDIENRNWPISANGKNHLEMSTADLLS